MRSSEIESEHSFNNIASNTFMPKSISRPCSSHVSSFSLVYNQAARALLLQGSDASGQEVGQHH
jgi:hypothetical protein